jgi:hypothetical protein
MCVYSNQIGFGAFINSQGELVDHIRLEHISKRLKNKFSHDMQNKRRDLEELRKLVIKRRPHVVALAAENMCVIWVLLRIIAVQSRTLHQN